jgi:hypothetical protein
MKDQHGTEITVGCWVREADLNFGDGEVESLEVPAGGGFNVGIKWKDPDKDGPGWSSEGGGRGCEHLVTIEKPQAEREAEQPQGEFQDWELSTLRFKERFSRSPTASEAELHPDDWSDIEVEEGGEEGNTGRQVGREDFGADFAAVVTTGKRIKICMGVPAKWYGVLLGDANDDGYMRWASTMAMCSACPPRSSRTTSS